MPTPIIAIVDPKAHSEILFEGRTVFVMATFDVGITDMKGQAEVRELGAGPRQRMLWMAVKKAFNNRIDITMFINTDEPVDDVKKRLLQFSPRPVIHNIVERTDQEMNDMWIAAKSNLLPQHSR